ncbi:MULTISPECIES: methyltransferase [Roseomonadaceae]|uniref:Methyltransferase n=1 Tax=Falsiroseomonas oleicola TaxID=2801474 RepID=A0ABS6H9R4_9PROT|nr:class I SAM-dependent methyltransferase [Roseomonas oleicola]MBU8545415.1 methyltransferase [Roseomonas oleicola]
MTQQSLGRIADPAPNRTGAPEWRGDAGAQRVFDKLFAPAQPATWHRVVEIGGGGRFTERLLALNPKARGWCFEAWEATRATTATRLAPLAAAGRVTVRALDTAAPGLMAETLAAAGQAGEVDAVLAIDGLLQADLSLLTACWLNAALMLKPGGRLLMTLADPNTPSGFQKILRDIRRFHRFQGRPCDRFGYVATDMVRAVLDRLGFVVDLLESWSNHEGRPPRDLYLSARLVFPDRAAAFRAALRPAAAPAGPPASYAEWWDREVPRALAGHAGRPPAEALLAQLLVPAEVETWRHAIEIGPGDARYTAALLRSQPRLRLTVFDVSDRVMQAAAAKLSLHVEEGRLGFLPIDPLHPDGMLAAFEREHLARTVDAVVSIDALMHVDLQYLVGYWLNAALLLKPGGWLAFSLADPTTAEGFARLLHDLPEAVAGPGQVGTRLEYHSFGLLRPLLERFGFDITCAGHWQATPTASGGRDLFIVAQLVRPEAAEALRGHISIGLAGPRFESGAEEAEPPMEPLAGLGGDEGGEFARILGQAVWRQLQRQGVPGLAADGRPTGWAENRRDYVRLGRQLLRDLAEMGITLHKAPAGPASARTGPSCASE